MSFNKKPAGKAEPKRTPSHVAYAVRDGKGEDQRGVWTRIGAFFPHEDGEGGTVVLDALPVGNRIVLRTPKSDDAEGGAR